MSTPFTNTGATPTSGTRSFWQRPEGNAGKAGLIALAIGAFFAIGSIAPILTSLFMNLTLMVGSFAALVISLVGLFILLKIIFSKKTRLLYKILCRKITGFFINLDPIAVMEEYTKGELPKKLEQVDNNMKKVKAEELRLGKDITDNTASIETEKSRVEEATRLLEVKAKEYQTLQDRYNNGDENVADTDLYAKQNEISEIEAAQKLALAQIGRLQTSNQQLGPLKADLTRIYEVLRKIMQVAKFTLADLQNEVNIAKRQRKSTEAAHGVLTGAISILTGKGDVSYEMYMEAREYNMESVAQMAGETIHMMEEATSFVNSAALTQGANVGKGWEVIRQIEQKANAALKRKGVAVTDVMQIEAAKGEILGQLPPSTLPMTVPPAGNNSSSEDRYKL